MEKEGMRLSQPEQLIFKVLGHRHNLADIHNKDSKTFQATKRHINSFRLNETTQLFKNLIEGLAQDNDTWDVDRRDGAVELLKMVNYPFLTEPSTIARTYAKAIESQNTNSDPYGSIYSLREIAPLISSVTQENIEENEQIAKAWTSLKKRTKSNPDWTYLHDKAGELKKMFKYSPEQDELECKKKAPRALEDRLKIAKNLFEKDKSVSYVAEEFGVVLDRARKYRRILQARGEIKSRNTRRDELLEQMKTLKTQGLSKRKIGKMLGVSHSTVERYI
jgi:hypothetical protein